MFRRFNSTSISPRLVVWRKSKIYRKCFTGAAIGVLGASYLAQGTIYGDTRGEEDNDRDKPSYPTPNTLSVAYPTSFNISAHHDDPVTERVVTRTASCTIDGNTGIKRIDVVSVPNFLPRWDTIGIASVSIVPLSTSWTIVGLFDGFGGPETKNYIPLPLITNLVKALIDLYPKYEIPSAEHMEVGMTPPREVTLDPYSEATDKTIKEVFLSLDNDIVHGIPENAMSSSSRAATIMPLGVALSGASVLLSFYDRDTRMLKLALAGNSRAILGRLSENKDVYEVHVLTAEHILQNPEEQTRINALYPDKQILTSPQWSGKGVTRAFGLAAYKWSRELQERVHRDYLGDIPFQDTLTPPYMTAEPVITTIEILPGDFLIMGSSGLWNSLTNEEAVGLVGLGIKRDMLFARQPRQRSTPAREVVERRELPVRLDLDNTEVYHSWRTDKRYLCINSNAAAYLTDNALGGADQDLTKALLAVQPPRSWRYRDDMNAAVIFFDS